MKTLRRFYSDEAGFVASADLILISTVLVLGIIVGLATLRDSITNELGDMSSALGQLNQGYEFDDIEVDGILSVGSSFLDMSDFCEEGDEEGDDNNDEPNEAPGCITIGSAAEQEGI